MVIMRGSSVVGIVRQRLPRSGALLLICLLIISCASKHRAVMSSSHYTFSMNGDKYRLHSVISEEKDHTFIRLIAKNFLAFDYDMDGIIDQVSIGDIDIQKVQDIYEFGIVKAASENKISFRTPADRQYRSESHNYVFEIKSYHPLNGMPFNKIRIMDKNRIVNPLVVIAIDEQADGILDELVTGTADLADVQQQYSRILETGLEDGGLIRIDSMILVNTE